MNTDSNQIPPSHWKKIKTIEMHTGGEPLRIIVEGLPDIKGKTILEKRRYFMENLDHIRTTTMWEPRGHADMYGAVITEPLSENADFGTFFLHNEGYSTMCGHATLALTKYVLDTGIIEKHGDEPELLIDAPPGLLKAKAFRNNGVVQSSSFINVPSFVAFIDEEVEVPGLGKIRFDVSYGGAFYAFVEADDLELELLPKNHAKLIDYGRRIKHSIMDYFEVIHPFEDDLSFLYGTIFTSKARDTKNHSRNVCIFADGELDRSATGSGVCARAALHYAKGELELSQKIRVESIIGSTMDVEIKAIQNYGPYPAVIPEVSGAAHFTGTNEFWIDPEDPLREGFLIR